MAYHPSEVSRTLREKKSRECFGRALRVFSLFLRIFAMSLQARPKKSRTPTSKRDVKNMSLWSVFNHRMSQFESSVIKPDKTVNRSFRISEKAYKALEEGAVRDKVSLNTFVNQLFLNYAEFDRFVNKVHPLDLPGPLLRLILDAIPEEKIMTVGKSWASNVLSKQQVLEMTGSFSSEGVIQTMKMIANHARFEYSDVVDHDGRRTFTIIHRLGRNYSLLAAYFMETILGSLGSGPIKHEVSDDSVMLDLPSSQSSVE
jgi:hypothetical protein